jgi:N-acetylmuramoyl-L-alanine amidase
MKVLLILDDGHGMDTPGKRTPNFPGGYHIKENEFNRPTVDKIEAKAKALGWEVYQTAPEINDVPLLTRSRRANKAAAEFKSKNPDGKVVFVSIHFNAIANTFEASTASGIEVFYYPNSTEGEKLAKEVYAELRKGTAQVERGVKAGNFHVIRETQMPAILVEAGFMDDEKEAKLMRNSAFQEEVATEVLMGVKNYLGFTVEVTEDDETSPWAREARKWAMDNGVSDGTDPKGTVTREEIWTMLHDYHQKFGYKPTTIPYYSPTWNEENTGTLPNYWEVTTTNLGDK